MRDSRGAARTIRRGRNRRGRRGPRRWKRRNAKAAQLRCGDRARRWRRRLRRSRRFADSAAQFRQRTSSSGASRCAFTSFSKPSSRCRRGSGLRRRSSSVASRILKKRVRSSSLNCAACSARRGRSSSGAAIRFESAPQTRATSKIAEMADRFAAEVLQILPVGDQAMNQAERAFRRLRGNRVDEFVEHAFGDHAQQFAHLRVGDGVAAVGDGLFEQRKPVAQAAFGGARQHRDRARIDRQIFRLGDALDFAGNFLERERAKLKKLRARFDRLDQIFGARGRQNEDDALGRLFESFQQRVGGFVGQLMRFVEDHHFVAAGGGRVAHHFAQFANLIDAAVRGRVDFEHVERSSRGNFAAGVAGVVGLGGRALRAVERFGENARRGGLSHAAHARKNVRVRHAIRLDRVRERLGDVLLADEVAERLRPVFSRDDFIAHENDCHSGRPVRISRAARRGTSGTPRHTKLTRYRCSLPGLAGFAGNRCTEPEVPPIGSRAEKHLLHDCFAESSTRVTGLKVTPANRGGNF